MERVIQASIPRLTNPKEPATENNISPFLHSLRHFVVQLSMFG